MTTELPPTSESGSTWGSWFGPTPPSDVAPVQSWADWTTEAVAGAADAVAAGAGHMASAVGMRGPAESEADSEAQKQIIKGMDNWTDGNLRKFVEYQRPDLDLDQDGTMDRTGLLFFARDAAKDTREASLSPKEKATFKKYNISLDLQFNKEELEDYVAVSRIKGFLNRAIATDAAAAGQIERSQEKRSRGFFRSLSEKERTALKDALNTPGQLEQLDEADLNQKVLDLNATTEEQQVLAEISWGGSHGQDASPAERKRHLADLILYRTLLKYVPARSMYAHSFSDFLEIPQRYDKVELFESDIDWTSIPEAGREDTWLDALTAMWKTTMPTPSARDAMAAAGPTGGDLNERFNRTITQTDAIGGGRRRTKKRRTKKRRSKKARTKKRKSKKRKSKKRTYRRY
jgi:hypothetical protein